MKFDARKREQRTRLKPSERNRSRWNVAGVQRQADAWKFNIDSIFTAIDSSVVLERSVKEERRDNDDDDDSTIVERRDVRSSDIRLGFSGERERPILMSGRR